MTTETEVSNMIFNTIPKPVLYNIRIISIDDRWPEPNPVLKDCGLYLFADEVDKKENVRLITNEFYHDNQNVEFEVQVEEVFINCSSYAHDCFIEGIKSLQENY